MDIGLKDIRKVSEKVRDEIAKKNLNPDIMKFDSVDQLLDLAPKNNEKNRQNRPRRRQMEQWR